jgi:16S rRNA (guanine527-N7)-methyltransferase
VIVAEPAADDPDVIARVLPDVRVSHETLERLRIHVDLLRRWQARLNLVAPETLASIWMRHVADSLQLMDLCPDARIWVDLGSGGGFPGLVLAAALADRAGRMVLIESDQRKAAFLREAARAMGLSVDIHAERIETALPRLRARPDVVTARALAPLHRLLDWSSPLVGNGVPGVFPKGRMAEQELTEARKSWMIDARLIASKTDPHARIVMVDRLARRPTG